MVRKYEERKLKVISKVESLGKLAGKKFYFEFEPLHEYLSNNRKLYDQLEEGHTYIIRYIPTSKLVMRRTASIQIDMKYVKVIKEIL